MPHRKNIRKMMGIGLLCLFLLGCSKENFLLSEEENENMVTKEALEEQEMAEVSSEVPETDDADHVTKEESEEVLEITVLGIHICGAVHKPGVYFLEEGQRICHVIEMAGGLTKEADGDYINQALLLEDGMKITVPTKAEVADWEAAKEEAEDSAKIGESKEQSITLVQTAEEEKKQASYLANANDTMSQTDAEQFLEQKVNLNTADVTLLCTLPGIGESRANSIISYRTKNGPFETIEDVMKVSGIKEAAFEKIKDKIIVSP